MLQYFYALKILFPEYIALFLSICISKTIWELLATQHGERIGWRWVNLALAGAAVVVILRFSVLGWQYIHGAGMAQLSDVVMNTVGAVIGTSAYAKSLREERRDA